MNHKKIKKKEDVEYRYPTENLWNPTNIEYTPREDTDDFFGITLTPYSAYEYDFVKNIIIKLAKVKEEPNISIAKMIKEHGLKINMIEKSNDITSIEYRNNSLVLNVSNLDKSVRNKVPMLLARNFAKVLYSKGCSHQNIKAIPDGYLGNSPLTQEYFADELGKKITENAGYSANEFFDELYCENSFNNKKQEKERAVKALPPEELLIAKFFSNMKKLLDKMDRYNNLISKKADAVKPITLYKNALRFFMEHKTLDAQKAKNTLEAKEMFNAEFQREGKQYSRLTKMTPTRVAFTKEELAKFYYTQRYSRGFIERNLNKKHNPDYNRELIHGYCTISVMSCFDKINKNGMLNAFVPKDKDDSAHSSTLLKHFLDNKNFSKYIYKTTNDMNDDMNDDVNNVDDLIERNNIKRGAFIFIPPFRNIGDANADISQHLVIYKGRDVDETQRAIGFNKNGANLMLSKSRSGYVIDFNSFIKDTLENEKIMQRKKSSTRNCK